MVLNEGTDLLMYCEVLKEILQKQEITVKQYRLKDSRRFKFEFFLYHLTGSV